MIFDRGMMYMCYDFQQRRLIVVALTVIQGNEYEIITLSMDSISSTR